MSATGDPPDNPTNPKKGANGSAATLVGMEEEGALEESRHGPPVTAPPVVIAELSASCVRFVFAKYKVPLDFTPDTLGVVDHYVKEARAELEARPEGRALIEASIGAYFGEVVRGAFESTWQAEGEYPEWRLSMSEVFLTFNPLGMAREALLGDDAAGWHAHIEMHEAERGEVERRLAALPEVADDEYYVLTTRFDVIELAVEALRARSRMMP
jgi:hypothetical protein